MLLLLFFFLWLFSLFWTGISWVHLLAKFHHVVTSIGTTCIVFSIITRLTLPSTLIKSNYFPALWFWNIWRNWFWKINYSLINLCMLLDVNCGSLRNYYFGIWIVHFYLSFTTATLLKFSRTSFGILPHYIIVTVVCYSLIIFRMYLFYTHFLLVLITLVLLFFSILTVFNIIHFLLLLHFFTAFFYIISLLWVIF